MNANDAPGARIICYPLKLVMGWRLFLLLALLCCAISPALGAENFLLISVDTLRADRLGCYGYKGNSTPAFDRWAAEGFHFQKAYSEYPLTLPSHSTLLTGVYPFTHGVRENAGFVLDERFTTLAELFSAAGYATGGFIGSYVLAAEFGMGQGFQVFDEDFSVAVESMEASTEVQRPAEEVTARLLDWLDRREGPFFGFVHYYDPHTPRPRGYDAEVTAVDRSLARIDAYLREKNLLEKTHIILTSDHGESLGEHGEEGHGFFIYDATLRVPLIIRPAQARVGPGGEIDHAVSLVDLAPTLVEMAGLEPSADFQGSSFLAALRGQSPAEKALYAETLIPEFHFGWSPLRSLRSGRFKYIEAPDPELYDLEADPGEQDNLYTKRSFLGAQYRQRLERLLKAHGAPAQPDATGEVDPETLKKLAALGYVKLGASRIKQDSAEAIDPKQRIEAFEEYHSLINRLSSGKADPTFLKQLDALKSRAPEMPGLNFLRAWTQELLGDLPAALQSYRSAASEAPDHPMVRARYAGLLLRARHYEEAERELEFIVDRNPEDFKSRNNLAGLLYVTGRSEEARREMEKIVELRPRYAPGWQNLGQLHLQAARWREAERAFRRVLSLDEQNAVAHLLLSQALSSQGKSGEAEAARQRAYRLNPALENQ